MLYVQMMRLALRIVWPHWLAPWRSPLLCWRMETYGMLDAQGIPLAAHAITRAQCWRFALANRHQLARFLRWAVDLQRT